MIENNSEIINEADEKYIILTIPILLEKEQQKNKQKEKNSVQRQMTVSRRMVLIWQSLWLTE